MEAKIAVLRENWEIYSTKDLVILMSWRSVSILISARETEFVINLSARESQIAIITKFENWNKSINWPLAISKKNSTTKQFVSTTESAKGREIVSKASALEKTTVRDICLRGLSINMETNQVNIYKGIRVGRKSSPLMS